MAPRRAQRRAAREPTGSTSDSVLGPFSNQGGSQCAALGRPTAAGRPGLCIGYREMVQQAFFPTLWQNTAQHLNGVTAHTAPSARTACVSPAGCDPFDGFVLNARRRPASPTNRLQFTQMEANFALFAGLAMQAYIEILISDDTPFDRFLDRNPQAIRAFSENMPLCTANRQPPAVPDAGRRIQSRVAAEPARRIACCGMDMFFGTNLSGRNPKFRSARCGNCHAGGFLSNNSIDIAAA